MDYFISDTHFNHSNIIKFERVDFKTIEEHDEFIMDLLEKKLSPSDVLYHLGDFGNPTEEIANRFKNLKCKKIIIRGNHDTSKNLLKPLFDEIYNEPIFYKKRILLSHEPLPVKDDTINVHGHLHGSKLTFNNYLNISFSVIGNKLITHKDLEKKLILLPKMSEKFLEEWYAPYYDFLIPNKGIVYINNTEEIDLVASKKQIKINKLVSIIDDYHKHWSKNNSIPVRFKKEEYETMNNVDIFLDIINNLKSRFSDIELTINQKFKKDPKIILYVISINNGEYVYDFQFINQVEEGK